MLKCVTCPWREPIQGWFITGNLGLAMFNLHTESGLYLHPLRRYERPYKMPKIWWFGMVMGHSRSPAMPPLDRAYMTFYSTLIETASISYRLLDIASYLSKVVDFSPFHLYLASLWEWPRSHFIGMFLVNKLESLGYPVVLSAWSYI